ncbi:MAG: PA0069 family radical SAM protein [Longimicrobiales bacterium]
MSERKSVHGRGAADNPKNRFERLAYEPEAEPPWDGDVPVPLTQLYRDTTRSVIARNDSPDIPFSASVNPYRGCEHGCIYCYARPTHEYLGFSAGLDFETKILVKTDAARLLRRELESPRWVPQVVALSGVTDPYQPIERKLRVTRSVLEILAEFRNPVTIITKNHLVTRDVDLLASLAQDDAVTVNVSITSLNEKLQRVMEPRTSIPKRRLAAVGTLAAAGIPVRVLVAPVIPGLTDHEIPAILAAAAKAGARDASWVMLRLPYGVKDLFEDWLGRHFPERREKVLGRIREVRDGRLNVPEFGVRMRGKGELAAQIGALFQAARKKARLPQDLPALSTAAFRRPAPHGQLGLFGEAS